MQKIKGFFGGLFRIYLAILFMSSVLVTYPIYRFLLLNDKYLELGFKITRLHCKFLLLISGVFVRIHNQERINKKQHYIILSNHSSFLDIPLLYYTINQHFVFMAKKELLSVPLFNIWFVKLNVTVDRKSRMGARDSLIKITQKLKERKSAVIFPEGTIPSSAPTMKNFKNGAFKVAIETQTPILPISFTKNYKLLYSCGGLFAGTAHPGITDAFIHEPISTKGMTEEDTQNLSDKVFHIINSKLDEK